MSKRQRITVAEIIHHDTNEDIFQYHNVAKICKMTYKNSK